MSSLSEALERDHSSFVSIPWFDKFVHMDVNTCKHCLVFPALLRLWVHYGMSRLTAERKHDGENWMDPAVVWLQVEKAGVFIPFSHENIFGVFLSECSQVLLTYLNTSPVICDYTNTDSANTKRKQLQNKPTGCSEIPTASPYLWPSPALLLYVLYRNITF